ncbi:hypothetical protein Tco_0023730 [Tanacetum coccineum]
MSTTRIFIYSDLDNESTDMFVSYIILSDLEAEDTTLPAALAPPSVDYVQASPEYISTLGLLRRTFRRLTLEESSKEDPLEEDSLKEDPMEDDEPRQAQIPLRRAYRLHLNRPLMMLALRKTVRASFTLLPYIEVAIAKENAAPPHKRRRSPSPPPSPSSSSS